MALPINSSDKKIVYAFVEVYVNKIIEKFNFHVAKNTPAKSDKNQRELRLFVKNKADNVTSNTPNEQMRTTLENTLKRDKQFSKITYNEISPNSSKYASLSFEFNGVSFDAVIARGSNKGENFETSTVKGLEGFFKSAGGSGSHMYEDVITKMREANKKFRPFEIQKVEQRKGSTKKEGVPIAQLGAIIGDIVLTDSMNQKWFISLKDTNGDTFSSYSGAATIFDNEGTLRPQSDGSKFLGSFGVDLNEVQKGFDLRAGKTTIRPQLENNQFQSFNVEAIFKRAWGMNYFYVRRQTSGWKVFWLGPETLDRLVRGIRVDDVKYPTVSSKQITIKCSNSYAKYVIEVRNSKAGEYPNDIKFKIKELDKSIYVK